MNKAYQARRMVRSEYQTSEDHVKRDAKGNLCNSAVEHESGAKVVGLSWLQACEIASERNAAEPVSYGMVPA